MRVLTAQQGGPASDAKEMENAQHHSAIKGKIRMQR